MRFSPSIAEHAFGRLKAETETRVTYYAVSEGVKLISPATLLQEDAAMDVKMNPDSEVKMTAGRTWSSEDTPSVQLQSLF